MWFTWNEDTGEFDGPPGWSLAYGWTLTSPEGEIWQFTDFEPTTHPRGRFVSYQSPHGIRYRVYDPAYPDDPDHPNADPYTDGGRIKGIQFISQNDGQTVYHYVDFSYATGQNDREHVASITVSRQASPTVNVERLLFTYRTLEIFPSSSSSSSSSPSRASCTACSRSLGRSRATRSGSLGQGLWADDGTNDLYYPQRAEVRA